MKMRIVFLMAMAVIASPLAAEDDMTTFNLGNDYFSSGSTVNHSEDGTDDLFIAGNTLKSTADISGSAHAAGRRILLQGTIGRDLYAAGMDVHLTAPVSGDATLAGYEIVLDGAVGGDVRAAGSDITINESVAGYALVAGETVALNNTISGDVTLAAEDVRFGSDARINGSLIVYEEETGDIVVPDYVVAENQIERRDIEHFNRHRMDDVLGVFDWRRALLKFIGMVILVAAIAALIAGFAPQFLADMRRRILTTPFRTLGLGFLTQSAVVGSAILFAMTLIGLLFTPASILLALILGFFGYVIGAYAFGVGLLLAIGRSEPHTFGDRALAAGVGALVVGLLGLIPFLGWLLVLAVVLAGIGAIANRMFRPRFFTDSQVAV